MLGLANTQLPTPFLVTPPLPRFIVPVITPVPLLSALRVTVVFDPVIVLVRFMVAPPSTLNVVLPARVIGPLKLVVVAPPARRAPSPATGPSPLRFSGSAVVTAAMEKSWPPEFTEVPATTSPSALL